jgi:copper transport protein
VNTFDVALSEAGQPLADAQRVTLRMSHQQMDMGTTDQRLDPVGDGHYRAQSGALSMAGDWDLKVIVRLAGRDDVQTETRLTATDPGAARNQPGVATASTSLPPTRFVVGAVLFALGVLLLVNAIRPGAHRRQRRTTLALGCAAVAVGLPLATLAALVPTAVDVVIPNPVPAAPASVARGQELYQQNCTICHGLGGRGDGPLARTLNPRPADLRVHVSQHTEGQLWLWISDGVPGTAMPAFRGSFSDEDRWNLINYLESQFGERQAGSPQ